MKIVHVILTGGFTPGLSYQENYFAKYHAEAGFDTYVMTSQYGWNEKGDWTIISSVGNEIYDGYNIIHLAYKGSNRFINRINQYFGRYIGVDEWLNRIQPDIIFVHNHEFFDIRHFIQYKKNKPSVRIFVDSHADLTNSAQNIIVRTFLYKGIWRYYAQLLNPCVECFYGVLPIRVNFFHEIFNIPIDRLKLLLMGADPDAVEIATSEASKKNIRDKYGIKDDEFLVVTGGKLDYPKRQTLLAMEAVKQIPNVRMLVFGSVEKQYQARFNELVDGEKIQYIGWLDEGHAYDVFGAAQLAVFPGRHSVYWEQVAGLGIPMVCKWWPGTDHIDAGGNVVFLYEDSVEEIANSISNIVSNEDLFSNMRSIAEENKMNFDYRVIAMQALE